MRAGLARIRSSRGLRDLAPRAELRGRKCNGTFRNRPTAGRLAV
jgi:hypothetical protein